MIRVNRLQWIIVASMSLLFGESLAGLQQGAQGPEPCQHCHMQSFPPVNKWNCILQGRVNATAGVGAYDIDGFDNSKRKVSKLHAVGALVICYISAGSWEDWRVDASQFPAMLLGNSNGWPGERWLDIRQMAQLKPIMRARVEMCQQKGFDAVDFDNVDAWQNEPGFPIRAEDQLAYNRMLANLAHEHGLMVALKNDTGQAQQLQPYFDFAINESCQYYNECSQLQVFVNNGKPVLNIEYLGNRSKICQRASEFNLISIKKRSNLKKWVRYCG